VVLWALAHSDGALADPPITPTAIPVVAGDKPTASSAGTNAAHAGNSTSAHDDLGGDANHAHMPAEEAAKPPAKPDWVRERLLDGETPNEAGEDRSVFESRLEVARRQRRNGNQEGAIRDLIGILKSAAPNDVKRPALLEMAGIAEDAGQAGRAQQILAQYTRLFSQHPSVVEVYLRQGLLYREMGATELALAKFHGVFSSALSQRFDQLDYYRRLVLQAQTEIADTYYLSGRWDEAREYLQRVMRLDTPRVTKTLIHYKLVRVLSELGRHDQTSAEAKLFLEAYPDAGQLPEVRFVLATALKKLGRNSESLEQVMRLLQAGKTSAAERPEEWMYWQKRAGNDIANQLYREGDYVGTLEIYRKLAELDASATWQLPVWYQIGLVYERLEQPARAAETYDKITAREADVKSEPGAANLLVVVEMARWRRGNLAWMQSASSNVAPLRPLVMVPSKETTE
jgi:tetratricopeptide (TPR) repeat protein